MVLLGVKIHSLCSLESIVGSHVGEDSSVSHECEKKGVIATPAVHRGGYAIYPEQDVVVLPVV